jgi:hypothetical protein
MSSGLAPTADIDERCWHFRDVPTAVIGQAVSIALATKKKAANRGGSCSLEMALGSGILTPPSQPSEKGTAHGYQAGQTSTDDGTGDGGYRKGARAKTPPRVESQV